MPWSWFKMTSVVLLLILHVPMIAGARLNEFISHFEPISYRLHSPTVSPVSAIGRRYRRGTAPTSLPPPPLKFQFNAHNRDFRVQVRADTSLFTNDVQFFGDSDRRLEYDTGQVYSGSLEDDDSSSVRGLIGAEGVFSGVINTPGEAYYLEPLSHYRLHPSVTPYSAHHSLVYRASDVHVSANQSHCHHSSTSTHQSSVDAVSVLPRPHGGAVLDSTDGDAARNEGARVARGRRSVSTAGWNKSGRTTCTLYLQADHLFTAEMGGEEAGIQAMILHVQQLNEIYKYVDFDLDGIQDNINFIIKRVRVYTNESLKNPHYRYDNHYSVEKYLEILSAENYDSFCLAYMFTYRDFQGGTLGLAWTGDLKQAGGVCERHGHYRGSKRSLNSGVVSILNYGKRVPPAVSHVTFAHEIGHSFGSKHDPEDDPECTPGGIDGNFLMYARATSGDKRNNKMFSPCSLRAILPVLRKKATSDKGCFTVPQASICGNGVVEKGEQCDCGWDSDCQERCCHPMSSDPQLARVACTLKPQAVCSPSQGVCCDRSCRLMTAGVCRRDNGCRNTSVCNGESAVCPPSQLRPDTTICDTQSVCYKGECSGSICLAYGLEPCQCSLEPNEPLIKACELCCREPGVNTKCRSTYEWGNYSVDIPGRHLSPGSPCLDHTGYCDVFQICRQVNPVGPLSTIKMWLFSSNGLSMIREFIDSYWYLVALALVAVILFLIAIIRIFGKPHHRRRRRRRRKSAKEERPKKTTSDKENRESVVSKEDAEEKSADRKEKIIELRTQPLDGAERLSRKTKNDRKSSSIVAPPDKKGITHSFAKFLALSRSKHRQADDRRRHSKQRGRRRRHSRTLYEKKKRKKESSVQIISYTNKTDIISNPVATEAETKVVNIPLINNKPDKFRKDAETKRHRISVKGDSSEARTKTDLSTNSEELKDVRGRSSRKQTPYSRSISQQIDGKEHQTVTRLRSRSSSPVKRKMNESTNFNRSLSSETGLLHTVTGQQIADSNGFDATVCNDKKPKPSSGKKTRPGLGDKARSGEDKHKRFQQDRPQTKHEGTTFTDIERHPDSRAKLAKASKRRDDVTAAAKVKSRKVSAIADQDTGHTSGSSKMRLLPDRIAKKLLGKASDRDKAANSRAMQDRLTRSNEHVLQWLMNSVSEDGSSDVISLGSPSITKRQTPVNESPPAVSLLAASPSPPPRPEVPPFSNASTPEHTRSQDMDSVNVSRDKAATCAAAGAAGTGLDRRSSVCLHKSRSTEGVGGACRPQYRRSVSHGAALSARSVRDPARQTSSRRHSRSADIDSADI